jgi:hypothetical protein
MEDSQQPFDPSIRRKKLDDLFVDEPFLSPTMKAHRLHQKLDHLPPPPGVASGPSKEARPAEVPIRPADVRPAPTLSFSSAAVPQDAPAESPPESGPLSLVEAARYIRWGSIGSRWELPDAERLQHFRDQVLRAWLRGAPRREAQR